MAGVELLIHSLLKHVPWSLITGSQHGKLFIDMTLRHELDLYVIEARHPDGASFSVSDSLHVQMVGGMNLHFTSLLEIPRGKSM